MDPSKMHPILSSKAVRGQTLERSSLHQADSLSGRTKAYQPLRPNDSTERTAPNSQSPFNLSEDRMLPQLSVLREGCSSGTLIGKGKRLANATNVSKATTVPNANQQLLKYPSMSNAQCVRQTLSYSGNGHDQEKEEREQLTKGQSHGDRLDGATSSHEVDLSQLPINDSFYQAMHTLPLELSESIVATLGPLGFETRQKDLASWYEKLKRKLTKAVSSIASALSYNNRKGTKKKISQTGSKTDKIARIMTYALKFVEQKRPDPFRSEPTGRKQVEVPTQTVGHSTHQSNTSVFQLGLSQNRNAILETPDEMEATAAASNPNYVAELSANEIVRVMHVVSEPQSQVAVSKIFQPSSRLTIDEDHSFGMSPVVAGWTEVCQRFNDESYSPEHIRPNDPELSHINPSRFETPRGVDSVKAAIAKLRTSYTEAKRRFEKSGSNDAEFFSCCNGNTVVLYVYHLLKEAPTLERGFPRELPEKVGVSTAGNIPIPPRERRARRQDTEDEGRLNTKRRKTSAQHDLGLAIREQTQSREQSSKRIYDIKERIVAAKEKESKVRTARYELKFKVEEVSALESFHSREETIFAQIEKVEERLDDSSLPESRREALEARRAMLINSHNRIMTLIEETGGDSGNIPTADK